MMEPDSDPGAQNAACYQSIVETQDDLIAVASMDLRLHYVNPAYNDVLGKSRGELQHTLFTAILHEEDVTPVAALVASLSQPPHRAYLEARVLTREGWRWYHWVFCCCVQNNASPERFIAVGRDVTAFRNREADRYEMERRIQQMQRLESLGVLAGGIAHDFNNLLMAIIGNADLAMIDLAESHPARPSVEAVIDAAHRAADLCRQMLAYSGKGRFMLNMFDVSELIREMTHLLEVSISKKAVLRYSLTEGLPAIEADVTQMRQVVVNLVTNASEAIGDRSGLIRITTGAIQCSRDYLKGVYLDENLPEGLYVFIEVADTGCGMDAAMRQRIFEPFFTTKFTGRGLGLAAVLGIVRGHKGAIKIYSERGQGSTFRVMLPAVDQTGGVESLTRPGADWQGAGTVLLVDDEETVRALGQRMLERLGFSVIAAADGREGVALFKEHKDEITCVMLDLTMPHMDGAEAFREIRRIQPDARVILSSGYTEQEATQQFAGKGLAAFMQKPYQIELLRNALKNILM